MIKYSLEFYKKSFSGDTMKEAYLKAVKWFSSKVLSKAEFTNVHAQYIKEDEGESPTITIHLFAVLDGEKDVLSKHCEICKEVQRSFFKSEETGCNRCNALAFQSRLDEKIGIKKSYYREKLTKYLEE